MGGFIQPIVWPMLTQSQEWAILLACVMMIADILTGFIGAVIRHDVDSSIMRKGLLHKVLVLVIIAVAYVLGVGLGYVSGINVNVPSTEVVCWYVIVMEITSVLENVSKAWPEFNGSSLFKALKSIGGGDDGGNE